MTKKIMILLSLIIVCSAIRAQEAVVSSGSYDEASVGSISWSLGETVIETWEEDGIILTQGFQQSALAVTSVHELTGLNYRITAFPNPAREYVTIQLDTDSFAKMMLELYDFKGMKILQKPFDSNLMQVSLQEMKAGVYFLKVIDDNTEVKIFKIVKQ